MEMDLACMVHFTYLEYSIDHRIDKMWGHSKVLFIELLAQFLEHTVFHQIEDAIDLKIYDFFNL